MPAISLIIPIRTLDAGSFSRLAKFAREFVDQFSANPPSILAAQPAAERKPAALTSSAICELVLPSARSGRLSIAQSSAASYSVQHLRVTGWSLEKALQQAIAVSSGRMIACSHSDQLPAPERFLEMCDRLSRADFVAGRRRASRASKFLLTAAQMPRRAVVGLQRRDPDFLCWVALREAVTDLRWRPAAHRFLAESVAARGFRVTECRVTDQPTFLPFTLAPHQAIRNLLAAWKLSRKTEQAKADLHRRAPARLNLPRRITHSQLIAAQHELESQPPVNKTNRHTM